MAKTVGIGHQDFESIRKEDFFYIDKTDFIREWWENGDNVTLITRPRRFGKTLTMSMVEKFFSVNCTNRADLFRGLSIWEHEKYRNMQGTWPVISLSFANVKETSFQNAQKKLCQIITNLYNQYDFLLDGDILNQKEKEYYRKISADMEAYIATDSLHVLSNYLAHYYGKKVLILLDEYDTPMQEAYVYGYWDEMSAFIRSLFNAAFKTNPYLERAIMTGITRVSKESIFSDLNNLKVITAISDQYADCFGFTEKEVFTALEEYGLFNQKQQVKEWYDGFSFGNKKDIYNPWSIISFLDDRRIGIYWANSSSNGLVGKFIRQGSPALKMTMESLLRGETFCTTLDDSIVFSQLTQSENAIWSLLLASGYLKVVHYEFNTIRRRAQYSLQLTNLEVEVMFEQMIADWFGSCRSSSNAFWQALIASDIKAMNLYMNKVALQTFSYFDTGAHPSGEEPERFYHGFVLGMLVELTDRFALTCNRESGFGRYDVMLEPKNQWDPAIIIEFKVQDSEEKELSDTVQDALQQIEDKNYQVSLVAKGIAKERIRKYGFAFCGKKVLIG